MICLTVKQPWADWILSGHKPVENRTWQSDYRGRALVTTSAQVSEEEFSAALRYGCERYAAPVPTHPEWGHLDGTVREERREMYRLRKKLWPFGALVGEVTITDCRPVNGGDWEDDSGFVFELSDPLRYAVPLACKGHQRLFSQLRDHTGTVRPLADWVRVAKLEATRKPSKTVRRTEMFK